MFQRLLLGAVISIIGCLGANADDRYSIHAIHVATLNDLSLARFIEGEDKEKKIDFAVYIWLLRSNERNILFDAGFYKDKWFHDRDISNYVRPDKAVELAGITADQVTDIVISHVHWDHMEGTFLFPNAQLWIQREELEFYAGRGYQLEEQEVDVDEMVQLIRKNAAGMVKLIEGDNVEIIPGLKVYTGGKHTYGSQYLLIENEQNWILTSDNAYLYRNIEDQIPIGVAVDKKRNLAAIKRMIGLAGDQSRVLPGHDMEIRRRFPTSNNITTIVE